MNKKIVTVGQIVLAIAGLTALTNLSIPAQALEFRTQAGETAGNPAGQTLYQVEISAEDVGDRFPVSWLLPSRGNVPDLSATAQFEVVEFTSNRLVLDIEMTNATAANFQAAVLSFGFGISPSARSVDLVAIEGNTATFDSAIINERNQNFPGGFKDINVCVFAANNCSGGSIQQGLQSGDRSDSFRVELMGNFGASPRVALTSFPLKFQTQAGSFELAGMFENVVVAQAPEMDDDEDDDDETTAEMEVEAEVVSETVLQTVSVESGVAISELEVLEIRQETWSDGCLGLGDSDTFCTQALVPGWRVVVASEQQVWVFRTNSSGSLVVLDQAATASRMSTWVTRTQTTTQTTTSQSSSQSSSQSGSQSSTVNVQQGSSSQVQMSLQQIEFSQTVQTAVFQSIVQRAQVSSSSLQLVEVQRRIWSDGCLGISRNTTCTQAQVPGFLVVARDQQRVWVYRTDLTGSVVVLDERATAMRMAQMQARRNNRISFRDVSANYWASSFIAELAALDIIAGYPDGNYRPERPVTRAELAAILRRAFEITEVRSATTFVDVERSYWAYTAIQEAYQMGFLNAVTSNQFRPVAQLSRADALFAIARGLNLSTTTSVETLLASYSDIRTLSNESRLLLAALTEQGIVVNYPNTRTLSLERVTTRAEVATFVYQTLVSLGYVESIESPYIVPGNTVLIQNGRPTANVPRQNCNQGIGNGPEGCDPGNSRPRGGSNDETGRTPGGRNR